MSSDEKQEAQLRFQAALLNTQAIHYREEGLAEGATLREHLEAQVARLTKALKLLQRQFHNSACLEWSEVLPDQHCAACEEASEVANSIKACGRWLTDEEVETMKQALREGSMHGASRWCEPALAIFEPKGGSDGGSEK